MAFRDQNPLFLTGSLGYQLGSEKQLVFLKCYSWDDHYPKMIINEK